MILTLRFMCNFNRFSHVAIPAVCTALKESHSHKQYGNICLQVIYLNLAITRRQEKRLEFITILKKIT